MLGFTRPLIYVASLAAAAITLRAADWPPVNYAEVRGYYYNGEHGEPVIMDGKLHPLVEPREGVLLTPPQVSRLLAAALHTSPKHVSLINCYEPRHGFVFYDKSKHPVAAIEVCLECLHVHYSPEGPESKSYIDFLALAQLSEDLGLPLGPRMTVPDLKVRLENDEKRWRERTKPISVKPTGGLREGVVFHFSDPMRDEPDSLNISSVFVLEKRSEREWLQVWSLTGGQSLRSITYGAKYEGLKESQPAEPLRRGKKYQVTVSHRINYDRSDSATFEIDETGAVVPSAIGTPVRQ